MLAKCIARRVIRVRSERLLHRSYYQRPPSFVPGFVQDFEQSGLAPLYEPQLTEEQQDAQSLDLKSRLSAEADYNEPEMDEDGLLQFYREMVFSGAEGLIESESEVLGPAWRIESGKRRKIIASMATRLGRSNGSFTLASPDTSSMSDELKRIDSSSYAGQDQRIGHAEASEAARTASGYGSKRLGQHVLDTLSRIPVPKGFDMTETSLKGKEKQTDGPIIPLGLVTVKEWQALFEEFIAARDYSSAEKTLLMMTQHGFSPVKAWMDRLVLAYARTGQTAEVDRLNAQLPRVFSDVEENQANALNAILHRSGHHKAIAVLQEHEQAGRPLSQKAYQVVLQRLSIPSRVYRPDSHTRALARDLFAHMRLVAHPYPDRTLYQTMILACASPLDPQPERARDLWIEMTTDGDFPAVQPDKDDYNAIIRALCTSKNDYLEGFDIFRQMLGKHQDAVRIPFDDTPRAVKSKYIPTLRTFSALFQGTKRAGDLERTRWLLVEMIKLVQASCLQQDVNVTGPDAGIVADVFHTYATWMPPPPKRAQLARVRDSPPDNAVGHSAGKPGEMPEYYDQVDMASLQASKQEDVQSQALEDHPGPSEPSPFPQTHTEALREASAIWERVLFDVNAARSGQASLLEFPFSQVRIDQRVIVGYLSVIFQHVWDVNEAKALWTDVFEKASQAVRVPKPHTASSSTSTELAKSLSEETSKGLGPNGWSYLKALEYCAHPPRMHSQASERKQAGKWDRRVALAWAKQLWKEYAALCDQIQPLRRWAIQPTDGSKSDGTSPMLSTAEARARVYSFGFGEREIEQAWKAVIRVHALAGEPLTALDIYHDFCARFPPSDILDLFRPISSNGLAIRVEDPTAVAEPNVPPNMTFEDVSDLHHELVKAMRATDQPDEVEKYSKAIASIKWTSLQYIKALFKRRDLRMSEIAGPQNLEHPLDAVPRLGASPKERALRRRDASIGVIDHLQRPRLMPARLPPQASRKETMPALGTSGTAAITKQENEEFLRMVSQRTPQAIGKLGTAKARGARTARGNFFKERSKQFSPATARMRRNARQ
ncbi:hypothetical protein BD324DRAFT_613050 [Kockovaella imperatae]|uniref:Pentatricopeptide repeat domain-containing protein n=1 Tax=Kockovaella imperatae TaxID=4999 RepID=A0A1Y1UUC9_9TREE|nr:hypothetical protein BD324DRAFT_613050 [Kockovaella imperatae]ORX41056.1 hypothetical protein BD324DRAFT_613050 [Kockovaella imperatae]